MNLYILLDSTTNLTSNSSTLIHELKTINIWIYISIIEFILILTLFYCLKISSQSARDRFRKEAINQNIDFGNIINSSFHSQKLYDLLKVRCHPDRFAGDEEKTKIAENIFQEITKNKTNLQKLESLKKESVEKLNIKL